MDGAGTGTEQALADGTGRRTQRGLRDGTGTGTEQALTDGTGTERALTVLEFYGFPFGSLRVPP